jgi:hypothetical protein
MLGRRLWSPSMQENLSLLVPRIEKHNNSVLVALK